MTRLVNCATLSARLFHSSQEIGLRYNRDVSFRFRAYSKSGRARHLELKVEKEDEGIYAAMLIGRVVLGTGIDIIPGEQR